MASNIDAFNQLGDGDLRRIGLLLALGCTPAQIARNATADGIMYAIQVYTAALYMQRNGLVTVEIV